MRLLVCCWSKGEPDLDLVSGRPYGDLLGERPLARLLCSSILCRLGSRGGGEPAGLVGGGEGEAAGLLMSGLCLRGSDRVAAAGAALSRCLALGGGDGLLESSES